MEPSYLENYINLRLDFASWQLYKEEMTGSFRLSKWKTDLDQLCYLTALALLELFPLVHLSHKYESNPHYVVGIVPGEGELKTGRKTVYSNTLKELSLTEIVPHTNKN